LYPFTTYWPLLAIAVAAWIGVAAAGRLYRPGRMRTLGHEIARAARSLLGVAAVLAVVGFMTQAMAMSRQLAVIYLAVALGALVLNRFALRAVLRALRSRGYLTRIFAVVGTSDVARGIAEAILARREWGYHLAGYIEEEGEPGPRRVGPVLGSLSKLQQILDNGVLDEIIFAVPHKRLAELEAAVLLCRKEGVTARICLDAYPASSRLSLEQLDGIALLGLHGS
ncbi:MAG TPA: sugar transferase, partial [Anaeromyxobacteraceae bacterium]|nr:sugar transferase [Anaeromyxobacteraceae bacterium]